MKKKVSKSVMKIFIKVISWKMLPYRICHIEKLILLSHKNYNEIKKKILDTIFCVTLKAIY